MSKFWAKVRFKQGENAEYLIRAFFRNFNPTSSIVVRGKEAKMEIAFQEPPMAIIDAIGHCEVIELNYGRNLTEYEEDENLKVEKPNDSEQEKTESKSTEQEEVESESSEKTKQQKKKREEQSTKKVNSTAITIPELEEIAKNSTSFKHFANLVSEWLEMGTKKNFFTNLVIASAEVDKITWPNLESTLKDKNIFCTQWYKVYSGRQVSKKLKEYSITLLSFLNVTSKYKEYAFKNVDEYSTVEYSNERATETEKEVINVEESAKESDEGVISNHRVKMECMPGIKDFEETLASVDKTQPVQERVRYVLEAMGLNELPEKEQKQLVEIASLAVKKEKINVDIIFADADIPIEQNKTVRMTFSKFINDFVQKYESGGEKVKLFNFFSELQKIVMFENEIDNS